MDYIINVKAQLLNDGSNLKTQYSAIKRDIEHQVINVKAVLDPNELSLKAIQKQLNEQKLTLNIANVEFNQSGMNVATNAVKNATGKIEESAKQATNAVKELSHAYSKLSKQDVYDALNSGSILKNGSAMSLGEKGTLKSIPQEERLFELAKIKKSFEETFGKTNVEVAGITNIDGALQRFIITAKNAKDEVLKFEYGLKALKEKTKDAEGNNIEKIIGGQFQYAGGTFGESSIREIEKANKLYAQHTDILNKATAAAREIWAVQSDRKNPIENVEMGITEGNGITTLSSDLDKLTPKTKEFVESYNEWVVAIHKANNELETQRSISNDTLNELTKARLATQTASKNAIAERTTATDYRTKDVTAEIEKAKEELKLFESKIAKVGLSLKDLVGDSGETLRDMLDNVSDSEGFAKYLDQLGIARARFKNLEDEIKTDAEAMQDYKKSMQDLISLNEKMASQRKKIIDAEYAGKSQETLQLLKDELNDLIVTYDKMFWDVVNNPLFGSLSNDELNKFYDSIDRNRRAVEARDADKVKNEYYQEQLKIQTEIDKLTAERIKLAGDSSEAHQRELQIINDKIIALEKEETRLDDIARKHLTEEDYLENQDRLIQVGNDKFDERQRLIGKIVDNLDSKVDSTYDSFAESISKEHFDKNLGSNGKSAITSDVDKINQLKNAYLEVVDALNVLKDSSNNQQLKENTEAVEEAIKKYNDLASAIKNVDSIGSDLSKLKTQTDKGLFAQNSDNQKVIELKSEIQDIANEYERLNGIFKSEGMDIELSQEFQALGNRIKNVSTDAGVLKKELQETKTAASLLDKKNALSNKIEMWLKNNTKASESMKRSMRELQNQIEFADGAKLTGLQQEFKRLKNVADATGQTGMRILDNLNEKIGKFSSWFGVSQFIMGAVNDTKEAIVTLKEVDSILTEISKTSDMSEESLKRLGNTAFESANKYGVTVQSFLTGVQEMSRAGYQDAEGMANLSILAQAAGDMTEEVADKYLIATDAAYKFNGSIDDLGKVLDGQNQITNRYAISMTDMASATQEAASMAANYGVSIEQLSALITTAVASTRQSGSEVGNALSTLFVNLSDTTNKERMKAFDTLGVSVYKFVDGAQRLKTPIELLDELATVFNRLEEGDPNRALLLNEIGGKHHANTLAAILSDWQKMDSIMNTYYSGFGSAEIEAAKSANNLQGSLNKLKNSFTDLVQNVANTDFLTTLVQGVNDLTNGIDFLVEKIGVIPTVLSGVGIGALVKNGGRVKNVYPQQYAAI